MRYALVYGALAGAIACLAIIAGITIGSGIGIFSTVWFGYLIMLIALALIFVGMKRYRDVEKGGVIRFVPALALGLATAVLAGIIYVAVWEGYLAATGYAFIEQFGSASPHAIHAHSVSPDAARHAAELQAIHDQLTNPLRRLWSEFLEIFPVGLAVALISAALLRNPRVFPARVRPA